MLLRCAQDGVVATVTLVCLRHTKASGNALWVSSKAREATKETHKRSKVKHGPIFWFFNLSLLMQDTDNNLRCQHVSVWGYKQHSRFQSGCLVYFHWEKKIKFKIPGFKRLHYSLRLKYFMHLYSKFNLAVSQSLPLDMNKRNGLF